MLWHRLIRVCNTVVSLSSSSRSIGRKLYLLISGVHDIRHVPETSDLCDEVWNEPPGSSPWYLLRDLGQMSVRYDETPSHNQEKKDPESDHIEDMLE